MLNALSHSKLQNNLQGKTVYFNKEGHYLTTYAFIGALSLPEVSASFNDALKQLIEAFPEKAEKFKKCKFMYQIPVRKEFREDGTYKEFFMDYASVNISDWEVGNAICGFNFNGYMRKKAKKSSNTEHTIEELVADRFPDQQPLTEEERVETKKLYINAINKISNSTVDTMALSLIKCLEHYEKIEIFVTLFMKTILMSNFTMKLYVLLMKELVKSEIVICTENEKIKSSILYRLMNDKVNELMDKAITEKLDPMENKNICMFYSNMAKYGLMSIDTFVDTCLSTIDLCESEEFAPDIIMVNLINMILNNCTALKVDHADLISKISGFIDDFGEQKHQLLLKDITEGVSKDNEDPEELHNLELDIITSDFEFEDADALCFLPAIKVTPGVKSLVEKHVAEREYEECENLEYAAIKVYKGYVDKVKEHEAFNRIESNDMPFWVKDEAIMNKMKQFSTSPDPQYPKMNTRVSDCGMFKKMYVMFSPVSDCYQDAGFAMRVLMKTKHYNSTKTEQTTVTFHHSLSESAKGHGKGHGKGGKGGKSGNKRHKR